MSNRLTNGLLETGSNDTASRVGKFRQNGFGMLEFLVALLIFSIGMMGLIAAQLAGKKGSFDAAQRSVATGLAGDMLERLRANPGQVESYRNIPIGGEGDRLPEPPNDCDTTACTASEMAAFDLWQWESLLLGANVQDQWGSVGGLLSPRACITGDGGLVTVAISWLGYATTGEPPQNACGESGIASGAQQEAQGGATMQRRLAFSTFIAGA